MAVIDQDLARWSRGQWFWAAALAFALQLALFWSARPVEPRLVYPAEPVLTVGRHGAEAPAPGLWLELEDPMLFAAPGWHGVSALAWMRKSQDSFELSREFPPLSFLPQSEARLAAPGPPSEMPARILPHQRPAPEPTLPVLPPPGPQPVSRFAAQGFGGRRPLHVPPLPIQTHNDVVSRTVVEAAVDPDGSVLSTRVISSSGSKKADADALALSRGLRFEPLRGLGDLPGDVAWGKLIFEWHALDLGGASAVPRP